MKVVRIFLVALLVLALAAGPALAANPKPQTVCPVLGGKIDNKVYVDYQGKRIYFCCLGCDAEFKKNPEKYLQKMAEEGVSLEKAPEVKK